MSLLATDPFYRTLQLDEANGDGAIVEGLLVMVSGGTVAKWDGTSTCAGVSLADVAAGGAVCVMLQASLDRAKIEEIYGRTLELAERQAILRDTGIILK